MKISELKTKLNGVTSLSFKLPSGEIVPKHFHLTEIGYTTKKFIDCGGIIHTESYATLQLWVAEDYDHRLSPKGFLKIIDISKSVLPEEDLELEVEYQIETINKFGLDFDGENFILTPRQTDCLAKEKCNIPQPKSDCCGTGCC